MGFFDDVAKWGADITGQSKKDQGQTTQNIAYQNLQHVAGQDPQEAAKQAAAAGQAVGNQMGQNAAQVGAQAAAQSARASGLNKGQAALLGSQQTGNLFTQGQQAGQLAGMQSYGNARGQNVAAAQSEAGLGGQQYGQGQQQGQDLWSGVSKLAGGASMFLSKGGITKGPSIAGEAGPEAVLPLNDRERMAQILEKLGLKKGAAEARAMKCPTCGQEMKQAKPAGKTDGAH